jgi:hypothetical protein
VRPPREKRQGGFPGLHLSGRLVREIEG